ncbi:TetR family transcriptional regulator [Virgibacillus indicus]|uniref:TetR family transcriptional regulator n=1 Tax=Virgibacillus indicus TaxID=2024554 RepID=A0A265NCE8_9BACI|nr:forespore capture DNA-binding protein RefZ [Virgibacillus indicus]OZU89698.1 TetR family transcriptional regulator [Virgibacillus indicus]
MKRKPSKQKVIDAAASLFFQKGFHGTSVRDIAEKASVNVSLISYYFKGKQGLLEYGVTQYYEEYLETLEEMLRNTDSLDSLEKLKNIIFTIIQYKQSHHQFSCFVHRELSLDSIFVREMAVTYLAKENHYISKTFFDALKESKRNIDEKHYLLMQLKGMLTTPYILHSDWKKLVTSDYSQQIFVQKYVKTIHQWLDFITFPETYSTEMKSFK